MKGVPAGLDALEKLFRGPTVGLELAVGMLMEVVDVEEKAEVLEPVGAAGTAFWDLGNRASEDACSLEEELISPFKAEGDEVAEVIAGKKELRKCRRIVVTWTSRGTNGQTRLLRRCCLCEDVRKKKQSMLELSDGSTARTRSQSECEVSG